MKNKFSDLHDAFHSANANVAMTPQGSGGFDLHPDTLAPKKASGKIQSPAQHAAVTKAGRTSAVKRKLSAGLPVIGSKPVVGM